MGGGNDSLLILHTVWIAFPPVSVYFAFTKKEKGTYYYKEEERYR